MKALHVFFVLPVAQCIVFNSSFYLMICILIFWKKKSFLFAILFLDLNSLECECISLYLTCLSKKNVSIEQFLTQKQKKNVKLKTKNKTNNENELQLWHTHPHSFSQTNKPKSLSKWIIEVNKIASRWKHELLKFASRPSIHHFCNRIDYRWNFSNVI